MRLARILGAIGRTLITAGTLILLFVAYQLWGTGIREAQAQNQLESEFEARLAEFEASVETTVVTEPDTTDQTTTTTTIPAPPPPLEGEGIGVIKIPDIGVEKVVVEGVKLSDLKRGPGHFPDTPFPGNEGNAAIAGHRTTYGAPFHNIDQLDPGDEIIVTTLQGEFRYEVMPQPTDQVDDGGNPVTSGHFIVSPSQIEVLDDFGDNRLTLTACHPKYSARQRIVVVAELVEEPAPAPPTTTTSPPVQSSPERPAEITDLAGEDASAVPAVAWGLAAATVWLVAWLIGRAWRKWPSYLLGLPVFAVVLFIFFENFSRLLPASY
ncbi:MAG TPA: class E sortase [Acidimicrobiales bacterium]|nr:class E sortase [Acidimicrobiales bacterium]